jgi:hypothetical protein
MSCAMIRCHLGSETSNMLTSQMTINVHERSVIFILLTSISVSWVAFYH